MARSSSLTMRLAALFILVLAAATIGGALVFEHGYGYIPCKLCLEQRIPYYVGMALALATALAPSGGAWQRIGLGLLALLFVASAGLGAYHAGVEWGFWLGPSDCGGGAGQPAADVSDFMKSLNGIKVVSCTEAAWRLFGLSLAGWNVLISILLAVVALGSLLRSR